MFCLFSVYSYYLTPRSGVEITASRDTIFLALIQWFGRVFRSESAATGTHSELVNDDVGVKHRVLPT